MRNRIVLTRAQRAIIPFYTRPVSNLSREKIRKVVIFLQFARDPRLTNIKLDRDSLQLRDWQMLRCTSIGLLPWLRATDIVYKAKTSELSFAPTPNNESIRANVLPVIVRELEMSEDLDWNGDKYSSIKAKIVWIHPSIHCPT